ncbi:YadA-like family protein [Phascolarctobacterium succinatutens]|uniref:YadA-like family protein n=2 Tax=Phascolarctobacterium succinatutens TaxID=626940 RepID=UPI00201B9673|nr:YadA-like family protein [Phascolarctobacterium succinatutens]UQT42890.1 YadA-like family protein [Phascolarctobacterium succinatutens]
MKKTRKQTVLAKCVLATIMAMGMMGYTTVWADTPTPSPVDKTVSKDAAGQIYDAAYGTDGWNRKYFWTDLGHAQVQIGSGEQIELFTPFIYHTYNDQWNPQGNGYRPVHTGDNSEMQCKESMSNITVGEFDRIIKSLYTNDITMAKTIYGEAGQAGLKDTVIKAVRATPGQGKTVNTYELVRSNDEVLAAAIVDTDTKITANKLTFADGTLTSNITDNAGGVYTDSVDGIASRSWVTNQLEDIAGTDTVTTVEAKTNMLKITDEGTNGNHAYKVDINGDQLGDFVKQYDTNTVTTAKADGKGYVNVAEMVDDNGNYNYTVGINEDKLINTIKANDKDTITTAESVHDIITVNNSMEGQEDGKHYQIGINEDALNGYIKETAQDTDTVTTVESQTNMLKITDEGTDGNHAYKVDINGDQLGDFVQQYDTNTVTTAKADGKGYVNVAEMVDDNGNYNYTVGINEDKLVETIQANDTNTVTTAQADGDGYVNVTEMVDDNGNYNYTVGINEDKLIQTIQENDTNTITTAESGHAIITVNDSVGGSGLDDKNYVIGIDEDALKGFIQENTQDTNTVTTVAVNTNILTIEDKGEDGNHAYELGINSDQLGDFVKQYDTNTITTAQDDGNGYVNVAEDVDADGNYKYTVGFDEAKLINTIKENDTNTVTTVADDGKGYIGVTDAMDADGNHNYTVAFDEGKLIQTIEAKDKFVNGGSIGADGKITLKVRNGEDVKLDGQLKDAQLTEIERDKAAGTATLVVKDGYTNEEVRRLTIDDIASKAQNDKEHAEFREHFSELDHRVDNLGSRVDKVGAGAAALAALHPMDFDPDDKLTFAAGYGNYKGRNAAAVGAFYRPDEKVMLSVGGTFGNGENMVNAGISFSLDRTARVSNSRTAMAKEIVDLRANVANLTALVGQLTAGMGGTIEMDRMKLFPDVPENHWAYEYIGRLAAAGIVEGYPDGMFNGNRMMSRYEFAAMLYRALEKGVKLDHKLVREFEPEMGRIHVARISGADGDRGKIERVRVYGGDNRDHYGSKLK